MKVMKEDNIDKIKSYIEDILGAKSSLREKLPVKISHEKKLFCEVLQNLQFVNGRTLGMKHDYKVNMMDYDDPFYVAIENLFRLHYTQEQRNVINWWLYDKFLPTGEVLILTDKATEEVIPSDTPEDIWDLIQQHKNEKKDNK
tara:strand:+ start:220 stop:648 length:429 start_codon:yes stop_codon:yes gene_type:complete